MDEYLKQNAVSNLLSLKMIREILLTRDRSSESKWDGVTLPDVDDAVEEVKLGGV